METGIQAEIPQANRADQLTRHQGAAIRPHRYAPPATGTDIPAVARSAQSGVTDQAQTILRFAADAVDAGIPTALVTLAEIRAGASRSLGAHMAVRSDGEYCGYVSGGCIEAAVAVEAIEAIACGADREVKFGLGSDYFDIVLPCGGGITLYVHVLRSSRPLRALLEALRERRGAGLRYCPVSQELEFVGRCVETGDDGAWFWTGYRPDTRIVIFGGSIEAEVTTSLARAAAYDVHACGDGRGISLAEMVDENTAIVLLFHDLEKEIPILESALASPAMYIGALGSSRTHNRRIEALIHLNYDGQAIDRIKSPIGIFPKARDARSLALSILAEVAAIDARRTNGIPPPPPASL
ncbi:XdhC family protein [Xanthomonas euvesicatoria]|uniref:XdhC family protein n=1 Tax=Xanthomonas euvesicatoria TaxID=456327 RepID=UPI001C489342|nr:XdhC family protein [Xanthomonas euvesicatoria]MBV6791634.1 XdhC family protein [Xanthomonas campestris pv. clerodendri]